MQQCFVLYIIYCSTALIIVDTYFSFSCEFGIVLSQIMSAFSFCFVANYIALSVWLLGIRGYETECCKTWEHCRLGEKQH